MLTIICGEDIVSSRQYFFDLKNNLKAKGTQVFEISPEKVEEIFRWMAQSGHLFEEKKAFFIENLYQKYLKRLKERKADLLRRLHELDEEVFVWENNLPAYQIKVKNQPVVIKEFKPPQSIFNLLDACYPGNFKEFINILHQLPKSIDEGMLFFLLVQRIRNIILHKKNQLHKIHPFQLKKIRFQAKLWPIEKLVDFYDGLYRIEVLTKTSATPFDIKKSLDILASFYL